MTDSTKGVARRAFVGGLGVGAAVIGTEMAAAPRANAAAAGRWQSSFDPKDDWLEIPGKHRLAFDATSADGAANALFFADNYIAANKSGYDLTESDLAVVIILRHFATVFAYNDAMWKKYGIFFSTLTKFTDPKTKKAPQVNVYNSADYDKSRPPHGVTLPGLQKMGVRYAVCGMATAAFAGMMAKQGLGKENEIHADLTANLIPGSHLVAAGIVAVNRTQEHGYAICSTG